LAGRPAINPEILTPTIGAAMKTLRERLTSRVNRFVEDWSLPRQAAGQNVYAEAAQSRLSRTWRPRLEEADTVGTSICPYCAVGCSQLIYAKDRKPIHVEGDPRSPVNQGTLCPKGAGVLGTLLSPKRINKVLYRAPRSTEWEERPLDWAMERIAQLTRKTRDETFVSQLPDGRTVNHTLGIGSLGGATMDNEENYLIKKLFGGGLGMVSIENQARI
jgi:formate dehydrogenase major subunit